MEKVLYIEGRRKGYSPDQCGETMTVGELIDKLSQYDRNIPIYLENDNGYTYGDIDNNSFKLLKTRVISIEEYLKRIELNEKAETIDDLIVITYNNSYESYSIEEANDIVFWGDVELVKDIYDNMRYFATSPSIPLF